MTPEARMAIFRRLQKANPRPKTELVYRSTFQLLVTVILSAQATDVSVNKATRPLFKIANTPEGLLELGETELKKYIRTIGLYNTKAKNILRTCRILLDEYGGEVPSDRKALEALPGVGRKTANIVLNIAFGEPTIAVDTHVFRVGNRTGLAPGKTPRAVEDALVACTPETLPARCPSLADPARPSCVQGAPARLPELRDRQVVRVSAQDRATRWGLSRSSISHSTRVVMPAARWSLMISAS